MKKRVSLVCLMILLVIFSVQVLCFANTTQDLLDAIDNGDSARVKEILAVGADINVRDEDGWTSLMEAACQLNFNSVKLLLSSGADINAKNNEGKSALMLVLEGSTKEHTRMANLLIEHGANVNDMDNDKNTIFARTNWLSHYDLLTYFGVDKFSSKHFDFYTIAGVDLTKELESIYTELSTNLLEFYEPDPPKKIVYLAIPMQNQWSAAAFYNSNLIIDQWYGANSHEVIHLFAHVKNSAFSEGVAQAFQKHGNIDAKEDNVSLIARKFLLSPKGKDFDISKIMPIRIMGNGVYYCLMGSFVYYNIYVAKNGKDFAKFLKSLEYGEDYPAIKQKYEAAVGKDLDVVIKDWEKWVKNIDEKSDIYVKW